MKKGVRHILTVALVALMITMLPGINKTVHAAEKNISETPIAIGDTVNVPNGNTYIINDDSHPNSATSVPVGTYTLSNQGFNTDTKKWTLRLTSTTNNETHIDLVFGEGKDFNGSEAIKGIKRKSFDSVIYTFELDYSYAYAFGTTNGGYYTYKVSSEDATYDATGAANFLLDKSLSVTVTAINNEGSVFAGWYEGVIEDGVVNGHTENLITRLAKITLTKDSTEKNLCAVFENATNITVTYDANKGTTGTDWPSENKEVITKYTTIKFSDFWSKIDSGNFITAPENYELCGVTITEGTKKTTIAKNDTTAEYTLTEDATITFEWSDYYYCKSGDGGTWKKGSTDTLDFTFDRSVEGPIGGQGIKIDDGTEYVDKSNYEEATGSWIVKLKPEYLETLSVGEHTLKVDIYDYAKNPVTAKFTILDKDKEPEKKKESSSSSSKTTAVYTAPKTGIE